MIADAKSSERPLPANWRWVTLGEVCDIAVGRTPARDTPRYWDGDLPWVTISDIKGESVTTTAERITRSGVAECNCRLVREGTLLFSFKLTIGKMAFAGCDLYTNEAIAALTPMDRHVLTGNYLRFALSHTDCTRGSSHAVKGRTLNQAGLNAIRIPLPPLREQNRIVDLLRHRMSAVEKARAAAQARAAAAQILPAAYLRQTFGDRPTFAASPVTPSNPTQREWSWRRLTDLARLATGHTPSRYCPEYWKGDIPWLQLADIRALDGHEVHDTSEHTNELGIANSAAVLLPKGTVCMSRTASVGFFAVMGRPMATSQDFVNWVCGPQLDPWFLMFLFMANRRAIRDLGSGAVHHTIYFPTVQSFSVCVPPLEIQRMIAGQLRNELMAAEKARAAAEGEIATIDALPAAVLRQAFYGDL